LNWAGLPKLLSQPVISKQVIQFTPQTISPKKNLEEILRDINIQVLETKYVTNLGQFLKNLEEILRDINIQVLETKYVTNLGQFLKIMLDIKRYIFKLVKSIQPI
jgi:hypothetical protein